MTQVKYRITDDALGFKDSLQITAPVFTSVASLLSVIGLKYAPSIGDAAHSNPLPVI